MKGCWLALAAGIIGLTGCVGKPKREMKQQFPEEMVTAQGAKYDNPPEYPRTEPALTPKIAQPFNMQGVGQQGPTSAMGGSPTAAGAAGRR